MPGAGSVLLSVGAASEPGGSDGRTQIARHVTQVLWEGAPPDVSV